ncbi:hypothetical protein IR083_21215 [Dysgonomonas sp. GY75]|uniref:hypothetical protein n=1 Tax=Dysgonomonas sp. GY75 TaxID=2780419 RepID=UPI001883D01C|nr:hypothetical protein [Dysgonomonas sp. GY75]MBF0651340.1 hypothetical protein [Dysgonomonas sp. GY75]
MERKIITSISFQNFYNYYGEYERNTYIFTEGLNILVADNGAGKSKFYNGFLWILQDQVYDSEGNGFDNVEDAKFKIISDKAKSESTLHEGVKSGVKINYKDDNAEYSIEKYFYSTRIFQEDPMDEKCWQLEELQQTVVRRDLHLKTFKPVYDTDEQNDIIQNIIQKGLRPYALLQGETIDEIIDFRQRDSLIKAINRLTDITKLRELVKVSGEVSVRSIKDLDNQRRKYSRNTVEATRKIEEKEAKCELLEQKENELEAFRTNSKYAQMELETLMNRITNVQKRVDSRKQIEDLEKEERRIRDEYDEFLNDINSFMFDSEHAWLLMGLDGEMVGFSNLRDDYIVKKATKNGLKEWSYPGFITSLPDGSPDFISLEKMLQQEKCFVCGRVAKNNTDEWKHIKKIKDRPSSEPKQKDNLPNELKEYFDDIQMNTQEYYKRILNVKADIKKTRERRNKFEEDIKDIQRKKEDAEQELFQFGGGKDPDRDVKDITVFGEVSSRVGELKHNIKDCETQINKLKQDIKNLDKEIESLSTADLPKEYAATVSLLNDIHQIMNNTKNRIFTEILSRLETNANKHFQSLTKGNNIKGGVLKLSQALDDTAIIEVKDEKGNPVTGLSEGFQRMKKLAVVMAIISSRDQNKTFDYPLIADAPLSAFGKGFIEGFFDEVPKVFSQSIILIKELYDKENDSKLNEIGEKLLKEAGVGSFYIIEPQNESNIERETKIIRYK